MIITRPDANATYYGSPVKARQLLSGQVPPPTGAAVLYRALHELEAAPSTFSRMLGSWTSRIDYSSGRSAAESSRLAFEAGGGHSSGGDALFRVPRLLLGRVPSEQPQQQIILAAAVPDDLMDGATDQEAADAALAAVLQAEEDEAYRTAMQQQQQGGGIIGSRGDRGAAAGLLQTTPRPAPPSSSVGLPRYERLPGEDDWSFQRRERLRLAGLRTVAAFDEMGFAIPGKKLDGTANELEVLSSDAQGKGALRPLDDEDDEPGAYLISSSRKEGLSAPFVAAKLSPEPQTHAKTRAEGLFEDGLSFPSGDEEDHESSSSILFSSLSDKTASRAAAVRALFGDGNDTVPAAVDSGDSPSSSSSSLPKKSSENANSNADTSRAKVVAPLFEADPSLEAIESFHDGAPSVVVEAMAAADAKMNSETVAAALEDAEQAGREENPFDDGDPFFDDESPYPSAPRTAIFQEIDDRSPRDESLTSVTV